MWRSFKAAPTSLRTARVKIRGEELSRYESDDRFSRENNSVRLMKSIDPFLFLQGNLHRWRSYWIINILITGINAKTRSLLCFRQAAEVSLTRAMLVRWNVDRAGDVAKRVRRLIYANKHSSRGDRANPEKNYTVVTLDQISMDKRHRRSSGR